MSLAFALFASEAQIGLMILAVAAATRRLHVAGRLVHRPVRFAGNKRRWFEGRCRREATGSAIGCRRRAVRHLRRSCGNNSARAVQSSPSAWSPSSVSFWGNSRPIQGYYDNDASYTVDLLVTITAMIGLLVALIVGIGMFDQDLGPRLNDFWRSRPIHPDLWFWTKYLAGLSILGLALVLARVDRLLVVVARRTCPRLHVRSRDNARLPHGVLCHSDRNNRSHSPASLCGYLGRWSSPRGRRNR